MLNNSILLVVVEDTIASVGVITCETMEKHNINEGLLIIIHTIKYVEFLNLW